MLGNKRITKVKTITTDGATSIQTTTPINICKTFKMNRIVARKAKTFAGATLQIPQNTLSKLEI